MLQYHEDGMRAVCASCGRQWQGHKKKSFKNLVCQWCKKGPLCRQCRFGFRGHPSSCNACVEALPVSRMVDVFPVDIETVHRAASRWALISARVVSAHAATRE